jgi:3-dehydro-L-gulonate 2-dehydrogenase
LNRFPGFIKQIETGRVVVDAEPERLAALGALERWDGHLGPGNLNAFFCMDRAMALAREHGVGCVGLSNTNHWMRAGSYGWQAAEAGFAAICWTNTTPNMPPWGGKEPKLGNNPLVLAVPRPEGHIVFDAAMTQFSFGKLGIHAAHGEPLPVEGGYDEQGRLTRDAEAIRRSRRSLPIGLWKGAGLSLTLDLIAAILGQGKATFEIGQKEGEYALCQVFIAFDVARATQADFIRRVVNETIEFMHGSAPAEPGARVYYPGERTALTRRENLEHGVPVEEDLWRRVLEM